MDTAARITEILGSTVVDLETIDHIFMDETVAGLETCTHRSFMAPFVTQAAEYTTWLRKLDGKPGLADGAVNECLDLLVAELLYVPTAAEMETECGLRDDADIPW